jgi:hypothetical protein
MGSFLRKPVVVFFLTMIGLSAVFFLIPINIFDGEYTFKVNGIVFSEEAKMSLSYFIGIGTSPEDLKDVVGFRLLPMGYFLVFLMLVAFPILIAYRVHVANQLEAQKEKENK